MLLTLARAFGLAVGLLLLLVGSRLQSTPSPTRTGHSLYLPYISFAQTQIRIAALHYDSQTAYEPDEAFHLINLEDQPINLANYQVSDGRRVARFPDLSLAPGEGLWCSLEAAAFRRSFGFVPGCEYGIDSDASVPNLAGSPLRFANTGGQLWLRDPAGRTIDLLLYEQTPVTAPAWHGPPVEPYAPANSLPAEGQILYRKGHWSSGQPFIDTDRALDWAQDPTDHLLGRRVAYPGWDLDLFSSPGIITATGTLTVALAPDHIYDVVRETLTSAHESIRLSSYTIEHLPLAHLLSTKARAGISVTLLLEGDPVGGISDQERYIAQLIEQSGGQVWFMVNDRNDAHDRYPYQHAKYVIVDDRLLLVSSENFSPEAMPDDDRRDGTLGRRGTVLVSDAQELVVRASTLFQADWDTISHNDLYRWTPDDPKYGAPPIGFLPTTESGGSGYESIHPEPLDLVGRFPAQMIQAPESSLLPAEQGGILGMVSQAGLGDVVLVQQLYERAHWGASSDTPETAPNLRLQAYVDAARRGARVRIQLDCFFDRGDNSQTADLVNGIATAEGLDLKARLGNPTGLGIHNKMILVLAAGHGWVHVGSLNGSESSHKVNRELAVQVQSTEVYQYLATAFWQDWHSDMACAPP
jgi:hypothetical protein